MKKSLIALAFGTLALGIAEFAMMGILPSVASDLGISISTAGHFISAYALGVCGGAPILLWARKYSLKHILIGLVVLMAAGNLCAAFSSGYWMLLLSRFVSGLPHGAYFGVASIVAGKLADEGRGSEAVSIMIAGMTVANLFGVPLGTSFSHLISWRVTFLLVGCWGIIVLYYIWRWIPHVEALQDTGFKGQFRFLKKPAPWLILGATASGFRIQCRKRYSAHGAGWLWYGGWQSCQWPPVRPLHTGACRYGCVGHPQYQPRACLLSLFQSLVFGLADGFMHCRPFCRVRSGAGAYYPCGSWWRNAGRCRRADSLQSGQRCGSLRGWVGSDGRIPLSGSGRCAFCVCRFSPVSGLLQEISEELLKFLIFFRMFVLAYSFCIFEMRRNKRGLLCKTELKQKDL